MKTLFTVLILSFSTAALGNSSLVGTWKLISSENETPNGEVVPYCSGVHGMIIYTEDGFMSVALNCAKEGSGSEPADASGRKFFYAGTYEFDGNLVAHDLTNASDIHLIGEKPIRKVELKGNTLILSGEIEGQVFRAAWVRQ